MTVAAVLGPIGSLGDHALEYAAAGYEVFPANPRTKAPFTTSGMKDATCDREVILGWWGQWPDALIAARVPPDIVILDIDPRHHGDETWTAIKAELGPMPETRAHYSGREDGGGHVWFRRPDGKLGTKALEVWAAERGIPESGIDLLHYGHRYTILPPSPHPVTGRPYRWKNGPDAPVLDMPMGLVLLVTVPEPRPVAPPWPRSSVGDSIIAWFNDHSLFSEILKGWTLRRGNGEENGSEWVHPDASNDKSATVRDGSLYVYSPRTPFEVTEDGAPHGYDHFDAWALLEHGGDRSRAARAARELRDGISAGWTPVAAPVPAPEPVEAGWTGPLPVDWSEFWARDRSEIEWVAYPILPRGRQAAIWAIHKTGKSLLTLDIAAACASGRSVLGEKAAEPITVVYLDMEMTEDDLEERLVDLGYGPETDLSRLHYYLLPSLPPLDTHEGGTVLAAIVDRHAADFVVIDTIARVTKGEENDADTYRDFYRCTGLLIKQRGASLLRLDHGGKDQTKGQRGSSAKGDDVDVVWKLEPRDQGKLLLRRERARMSWIPEKVNIDRLAEPLRHVIDGDPGYAPGTKELAAELAAAGFAVDLSAEKVMRAMREASGVAAPRKARVIDAQRWRRAEMPEFGSEIEPDKEDDSCPLY